MPTVILAMEWVRRVGTMEMGDMPTYRNAIDFLKEAYQDRIEIYRSLEVDFIPGVISIHSPHIKMQI